MQKINLPEQWQLRAVGRTDEVPQSVLNRDIPAIVPGCVHLDLMREELIPDPYLDLNEALVQWIGVTDWEYSTTFEIDQSALSEERVDLVCEGLDTIATVWVNDVEVGKSENMHVERRFAVKEHLRAGENTLRIRFDSAVYYARENMEKLGELPHASSFSNTEPFHFIRKNACNFGWDWGPGLTTAGVWKPIRLEAWSVARIKSVKPLVKVANEKVAVVDVMVDVEFASEKSQEASDLFIEAMLVKDGETTALIDASVRDLSGHDNTEAFGLTVRDPELWWPRGYGEQPLYSLNVSIFEAEEETGETQDEWKHKIGLREVELDTTPDEIGAAWTVKINGQEIWCKGANWIPDDVFLTRANQPARLRQRLEQAADANMNMMRIWGGGIYETDEFYDICDELGLLVWQDFLFACAAYSEDEDTWASVEEEARFNVTRLSKHPSLVLWNGCNENIWGFFDWNWEPKLEGRAWGAGYYFDLLPRVVAEIDPSRPYWAGSPYSGSMLIHPNADAYGNKHMWDTWNDVNFTFFRKYSPRFASEFGHQSPPTFSTLSRAIPEGKRDPFSVSMLSHQKAAGGNEKLHARLLEHFVMPEGLDDWIYLNQLVQARAMTVACEWFRTRSQCKGALYWQLNDCWPVCSWAAIDGDGQPKPLYYATKRFFRDRLLTIQPDGEGLALWAHNDTDRTWVDTCDVWMESLQGESWADKSYMFEFNVPPRQLMRVGSLDDLAPRNSQNDFLRADCHDTEAYWFFDADKNLRYPEPKWTTEVDGSTLRITAETLLRDLTINVDRFGGSIGENCVTLLPGETWGVEITGTDLSEVDFSGRPIVQCANWYGAKAE